MYKNELNENYEMEFSKPIIIREIYKDNLYLALVHSKMEGNDYLPLLSIIKINNDVSMTR